MTQIAIDKIHQANTTALGGNLPYSGLEWRSSHKPDYLLYVFNISARTYENVGRINMRIPGVNENDPTTVMVGNDEKPGEEMQKYHYVTSFPQPVLLPKPNDQSGEIEFVETDARRFVVDLINPDNLTLSLDTVIKDDQRFSIGNDYSRRGVFFSYSNPPAREDVKKAYARMEKYYNELLDKAATLEMTDKAKLSQELSGNPDYSFAANYFGKDVAWNRKNVRPVECPNCGENKPGGRKFHVTSFGSLCVEPTIEAWKAVVNSGVKRYEDVPEDFQWKKDVELDKIATKIKP